MDEIIGKTISKLVEWHIDGYDDEGVLQMVFTDGSEIFFIGCYGGYTGESADEYPVFIYTMTREQFDKWNDGFGWDDRKYEPKS